MRNPLAFLLESADDIAYATADFEDALYKDMIQLKDIKDRTNIEKCVNESMNPTEKAKYFSDSNFNWLIEKLEDPSTEKNRLNVIHSWIEEMRKLLIYVAVYEFNTNYSNILDGNFQSELILAEDSNLNYFLRMLKE